MQAFIEILKTITPHQWFLIGGLVAAVAGAMGITEYVKRRHLRIKAEKLWTGFVFINVTVWSFLLTTADAILANIGQITHISSLVPAVSPFVSVWGPRVSIAVLLIHTIATVVKKWWVARKENKPLFADSLPSISNPNLQPAMATVSTTVSGMRNSSQGTEASGNPQIIQL